MLLKYRKSSIKPPWAYFFQSGFMGGLIEKLGGGGTNLICGKTGYHTAFPIKEKNIDGIIILHKERTVGKKKRSCS